MDKALAKTISGFSDFVTDLKPDLIIVHGDRVEALAGAVVGSLNNILVAHIEGGEVSGTVDELIRHAVSKMSHAHFVTDSKAKDRLIQLGERPDTIFVIGSPDLDMMNAKCMPELELVKEYYGIAFSDYAIALFHPVTTEYSSTAVRARDFVSALIASEMNFVVIYPNNDLGSNEILSEYSRFEGNQRFKVLPSMRFEYFLTLMKNCQFIIGNSSAGLKEAPTLGVPTIDVGTRQLNRVRLNSIINVDCTMESLLVAINDLKGSKTQLVPFLPYQT